MMLWFGLIVLAVGVLLHRWVRGRQFSRRNAAGVEEFNTYDAAVAIRALERLVLILSRLCMATGVVFTGLSLISGV